MTAVRKATASDVPALSEMLARAFFDDPVISWMVPSDERRRRKGPYGYSVWLRDIYLPKGEVYCDDECRAAALWAPPGAWKIPMSSQLRLLPKFVRTFGVLRFPLITRALTISDAHHPDAIPHWYLGILGTDTDHQGKGLGSALLAPMLERCDASGVPAFLESSKDRNVPFYARHGFEVLEEYRLPNGPPIWAMWREPR